MCRSSGIKAKKVSVVHNAAGPQFFDSRSLDDIRRVKQKYGLPDRYFLYVGGFDIRKNVAALVEAFAGLSESASSLVLAGEQKWDFEPVSRLIEKLNVSDRVNCPGTIAEDDLPALYSAALAYVYPSLYEGFGLQLVEAMASGIPVLASQTTSLPEILGDAGLLFDPRDPASISGQMERVERDGELRASMIARGLLRARTFSWRATAEQTLSVYSEVLGESKERAMPLPLAQEQRG
jgi:glycosyltransferase involved in cell wall biosynthesis